MVDYAYRGLRTLRWTRRQDTAWGHGAMGIILSARVQGPSLGTAKRRPREGPRFLGTVAGILHSRASHASSEV